MGTGGFGREAGRAGVGRRSERSLKRRGRVSEAGKPGKSGRWRFGTLRFRLNRGETSKANDQSRCFSKALRENNHLRARGQMNGNYGFTGGVWISDRLIGIRRQSMCGSIWCWLREIPAASAPRPFVSRTYETAWGRSADSHRAVPAAPILRANGVTARCVR